MPMRVEEVEVNIEDSFPQQYLDRREGAPIKRVAVVYFEKNRLPARKMAFSLTADDSCGCAQEKCPAAGFARRCPSTRSAKRRDESLTPAVPPVPFRSSAAKIGSRASSGRRLSLWSGRPALPKRASDAAKVQTAS